MSNITNTAKKVTNAILNSSTLGNAVRNFSGQANAYANKLNNEAGILSAGSGTNMTQRAYPSSTEGYNTNVSIAPRVVDNRSPGFNPDYVARVNNKSSVAGARTGGSSSGSANSTADAYNALLAAYRANDYSDYYNQMKAAAQAAYDRGMGALNDAYNAQLSSLSSNLADTKNQLANQYNYSRGNINNDAADSLRQAYINRMNSQRNLGQQMSAQGLTGGATETTMANMLNNYGNARNNIQTTANRSLADLEQNYNSNLSQAMQAYNSAVANANLQKAQQAIALENALANNQISALGDYQSLMQRENQNYLDLLKTAIANGANFTYTPTEANNAVNAVAVQQASMPTTNTNYEAVQSLMNAYNNGGGGAVALTNPYTSQNSLAQILAQLQKGA